MDGELPVDEADLLRDHLEACPPCYQEYESLLYSFDLVDKMPALAFDSERSWKKIETAIVDPPALTPKPANSRRSDSGGRFSWLRLRPWVPVAAFVGAILLAITFFMVAPVYQHHQRVERAFRSYIEERDHQSLRHNNAVRTSDVVFEPGHSNNPFSDRSRSFDGNPFELE